MNSLQKLFLQYLSNKDAGESIIRPSSKGPSFLTLTIKIYDDVYAHKDIVEDGKDRKDITSLLRLGKTLEIDKEKFEDLDEVSILTCLCKGFNYLIFLLLNGSKHARKKSIVCL